MTSSLPPGWLRSMIHGQYDFITGKGAESFMPDKEHGLTVQRFVTLMAEYLHKFRNLTS